ncbi:MAG: ABC transporter ATP-binding protein [Calditrichaeota bacterium]|nr:ABC transporter ATP-binding protein [Calditrichota bacterium]
MYQNSDQHSLLEVKGLKKHFPIRRGFVRRVIGSVKAVDDVNFAVASGETLGLVGESGCGKTTTGRVVLRLLQSTAGSIVYAGEDITALRGEALRRIRRKMQIVFQDPYSSLNPRITIGGMLREILRFHRLAQDKMIPERINEILDSVGLSPLYANRYPHEFSGGQRQRIGIARALAVGPEFIVLDEPVSALDVSIQAQILNLLQDLQRKFTLSYLLIAHDLSVVEHIANRIAVMYLGRIVEIGPSELIVRESLHPYTQALISAVPVTDPLERHPRAPLGGDVPSPASPPSGCHFHPRCPQAKTLCREWQFKLKSISADRQVGCVLYN